MDKGIIMWIILLVVIAGIMLVSHRIKKGINENGIETDAVVSRITDNGSQEDIAETVLFLASEQARMLTGQVIKVSGGHAL